MAWSKNPKGPPPLRAGLEQGCATANPRRSRPHDGGSDADEATAAAGCCVPQQGLTTSRRTDNRRSGGSSVESDGRGEEGRYKSCEGGRGVKRGVDDDDDGNVRHHMMSMIGEERPSVLDHVLSRLTTRSSYDPGPPPDGGRLAWTQCFVGHVVNFNSWGWINSFGTFQAYYTSRLGRSPSDVAWIGSINIFLLFFVGTLTGRLVDAGYFRAVFLCGTVLLAVGIFAVSACATYWQFMLAQGLCLGIAHGCLFCPALAVLASYFQDHRALVLGIAACGSATGGVVFPLMVRQLLPTVGFAWTVRAMGFVQVSLMVVANLLARARTKPRRTGPLADWSAFGDPSYVLYACAAFFIFWGAYFALFYVAAFSRDALDPPFSYSDSLNLLLILNSVGIVGRLAPSWAADRVGAINMIIPITVAACVVIFSFMVIRTATALYTWVVLYGLVVAGIQSLFPAGLSLLTTDLRRLGVRMGMVFTIISFATLTGPPIAGTIIAGPWGYRGAQAFAGCSVSVGSAFLVAVKVISMRATGRGWTDKL